MLDGVVGVRTATGFGTVTTVVGGDVLSKDNVSWAGRLGALHDGWFVLENFRRWLIKFSHHAGCKAAKENGDRKESDAAGCVVHINSTTWTVYETLALTTGTSLCNCLAACR